MYLRSIKQILLAVFIFALIPLLSVKVFAVSDTTGPELNLSSLQFESSVIGINEYNTLSAIVTDPSGVTSVSYHTNKGASSFLSEDYEHFTGYFKGQEYGRVQLEAINARDGCGNSALYVDEQCQEEYSNWGSGEIHVVDFSNLYFDVVGDIEEDTTGPELILSRLKFEKSILGINEYNTLSAEITDPSGVTSVTYYTNKGASSFLSEDYEHFTGYFKGQEYGRVQLEAINARDGCGNSALYVDEQCQEEYVNWTSGEIHIVDFSRQYFYVLESGFLESILILPNSLTTIESESFINLTSAKAVQIPVSVTYIASDAFDTSIVIVAPPSSYAIQWARDNKFAYITE